jgi:hypothetical protein
VITINWGKEDKTVLLYEFEDGWSVEDLTDALDAGVEVAGRYDHDMDVIVDLSKSGVPDLFGMGMGKAFQQAMNRTSDHMDSSDKELGLIVIVAGNGIIRNTLRSLMQMHHRLSDKIAVADSRAEALNTIEAYRETTVAPGLTA